VTDQWAAFTAEREVNAMLDTTVHEEKNGGKP
jgi:hypothetical protein